jgi:hypothetical protein
MMQQLLNIAPYFRFRRRFAVLFPPFFTEF